MLDCSSHVIDTCSNREKCGQTGPNLSVFHDEVVRRDIAQSGKKSTDEAGDEAVEQYCSVPTVASVTRDACLRIEAISGRGDA